MIPIPSRGFVGSMNSVMVWFFTYKYSNMEVNDDFQLEMRVTIC